MKNYLYPILVCFLLYGQDSIAQQADSFLIATCFEHFIEDGKITQKKFATSQKTYNRNSKLVREVFYSSESYQPELIYYFHYKNSNLLFKEGITLSNEPSHYITYTYSDGKLVAKTEYKFRNKAPYIFSNIKYKYKGDNVQETHYNANKKKYMTVTKDNSNPNKKIANYIYRINDSLASKTMTYTFDNSVLISIEHVLTYKNGITDSTITKYTYDNNRRISRIDDYNSVGKMQFRYSYLYFADGRISSVNKVNDKFAVLSNKSYIYKESDLIIPNRVIPSVK